MAEVVVMAVVTRAVAAVNVAVTSAMVSVVSVLKVNEATEI